MYFRFASAALCMAVMASVAHAQGFTPEEALKRMRPEPGLEVKLVAAEPLVRQPVTMTFDTKGRLWVIQYLQYPTPAGLKPVQVDQYLRTKYDRVPEPPPNGPKGADRITILFDPDENGRFRRSKDFVTGLNLASGMALGYGGVFVLQAPYLLFYPDKDGDDVPDGPPEVLLTGFGMEDAHAVANSLQWGPDGWLYGAQGSTVTANIRGVEFQQGIWRYHPVTKQFELFAEGGGNTWGLDFDAHGQAIAGTNFGGFACLHMVQGGYYVKGFTKHGPLHNPHAYGYFDHVPCEGFKGGHVTCGGIVYQGNLLPEHYRGAYLAGNLLDNDLHWYTFARRGSTYTSKFAGTLLEGNDTWFRPIDLLTGPDGAVYVADWYDKRANHVDPVDNWDRSNGRIYKLTVPGAKPLPPFDLAKLTSAELVKLLDHPNSWQRGEARRLLAERRDKAVVPQLKRLALSNTDNLALDALWTLHAFRAVDEEMVEKLVNHPNEDVRAWMVRLAGETVGGSGQVRQRFVTMAERDNSPTVRSQLACTAKRALQPECTSGMEVEEPDGVAVLAALLHRNEDADDPHIPLLIWWGIERQMSFPRQWHLTRALGLDRKEVRERPLVRRHILERYARRCIATNGLFFTAEDLIEAVTAGGADDGSLALCLAGMEKGLEGRPPNDALLLREVLDKIAFTQPDNLALLRVQVRLRETDARSRAMRLMTSYDAKVNEAERAALIAAISQNASAGDVPTFLHAFREAKGDALRTAALDALAPFDEVGTTAALLTSYSKLSSPLRSKSIAMLCARQASALALLRAVDEGTISPKDIPLEQVQRTLRFRDPAIDKLVTKHWGSVSPQTTGEKRARIASVVHLLGQEKGDPAKGKPLFQQLCANCHTLFGEGGHVGPELTGADRKNREYLATHVVDPSLVIRPEYTAHTLLTTDGRLLTGLLAESTPAAVTLLDDKGRTVVPRDKVEELKPSAASLMPEKLLDPLDDQQIRDLFAYLQGDGANDRKPAPSPPAPLPQGERGERQPLPGTQPLTFQGDPADVMVAGIDRFLLKEIDQAVERRARHWHRDTSSPETYEKSVAPNRERLRQIIGVVDERPRTPVMEYVATTKQPALVGKGDGFEVFAVRWRAFGNVDGEGLLLVPTGGKPVADVVAIPDADQLPEQLAGLLPGIPPEAQTARRLAEVGCRVIVPLLMDRRDTYSGLPGVRMTNQPHREWIYRQAYEMGRHVIGYELQKVLAAVDWLAAERGDGKSKIGVIGYGEGGLLAMYAGALDPRIDVTGVSGYFGRRERVWEEPVYRNVWRLLEEFGDAEVASLFAGRALAIDSCRNPAVSGPPKPQGQRFAAAAPGFIATPMLGNSDEEFQRARRLVGERLSAAWSHDNAPGLNAYTAETLVHTPLPRQHPRPDAFLASMLPKAKPSRTDHPATHLRSDFDPEPRFKRQFDQLVEHTQKLVRESENARQAFWAKADRSSVERWQESTRAYRERFAKDLIGEFDIPLSPPNVRTGQVYDEPSYTGYEVVMDVFAPDVIGHGILLVPKDMKPGERRPVVVCQHGLEGRPQDVADPKKDHPAYHRFACQLAERGFVVYAPQNPYVFGDRFRNLQRKANPLGKSLFSIIVPQHRQATEWLASLTFVDPDRIAFYGLSYGGKTAMRVPPLVPRYCVSICSADFNEWVWKNTSTTSPYSYLLTNEYEMVEWNLANTFDYAEMAGLIAPRPFMVERGHRDNVAPDEWVAYEFAKVRRLYADLKLPGRTEIEFFDGPHTINGKGTFAFLHKHLNWPPP